MIKTPAELDALVETVIRALKSAGLNAQPLERVRTTAFTTGNEWLGELGLAVREVGKQKIPDETIRIDLARIRNEVHNVWPNLPPAAGSRS